MTTEKLYWQRPEARAFEVPSFQKSAYRGAPSVVLPSTLFYPEAGGQLGDRGELTIGDRTIAVVDTQIDEAGVIHHLVGELPEDLPEGAGCPARGALDAARRDDQTAQHTAQHMLSQALVEAARAETLSARLGEQTSTIDVDAASLDDAALARAEDRVNAVIRADVPVTASFPSPDELARLPLRRAPKVATGIRVVIVADFDVTPCGGTHVATTGRIGAVHVGGVERYKGGTRVTFVAAARAIDKARQDARRIAALCRELTCGPADIGAQVDKARADLRAAQAAASALRGELARHVADAHLAALPDGAFGVVLVVRDDADVPMLRAIAERVTSRPRLVAVCVARDGAGGRPVVVQRGAGAEVDCGKLLKALAASAGGRGGGRPERAEGRLEDVGDDVLASLVKSLPHPASA